VSARPAAFNVGNLHTVILLRIHVAGITKRNACTAVVTSFLVNNYLWHKSGPRIECYLMNLLLSDTVPDARIKFRRQFKKYDSSTTSLLLTVFNPNAIKNMAQGSVFRGHYSNQFDCNGPQLLALALFIFHLADLSEPLHPEDLAFFCDLP
jgi:hypothetical protein